MKSLLGNFYTKIRGSQEDIASMGLVYILNQSRESRDALHKLIKSKINLPISDLNYCVQNTGDNMERPDICGMDENGVEKLIIEAKFWASLTENQPIGYLKRLKKKSLLIFLVPSPRMRAVYGEVKTRMKSEYNYIETNSNEILHLKIADSNQNVLMLSWFEVLHTIKDALEKSNETTLTADVIQLIGLCNVIDNNSFLPITKKDMSKKIPKAIVSYYEIVDKVVDELKNTNNEISVKGLQKTPVKYGYHRYFKNKSLGMSMSLKLDLWHEYDASPFWFGFQEILNNEWQQTENCKKTVKKLKEKGQLVVELNNTFFVGLQPKLDETEDRVIGELSKQIENIISDFEKQMVVA